MSDDSSDRSPDGSTDESSRAFLAGSSSGVGHNNEYTYPTYTREQHEADRARALAVFVQENKKP